MPTIKFTVDAEYHEAGEMGKPKRRVHKAGTVLSNISEASAERWVRRKVAERVSEAPQPIAPPAPVPPAPSEIQGDGAVPFAPGLNTGEGPGKSETPAPVPPAPAAAEAAAAAPTPAPGRRGRPAQPVAPVAPGEGNG